MVHGRLHKVELLWCDKSRHGGDWLGKQREYPQLNWSSWLFLCFRVSNWNDWSCFSDWNCSWLFNFDKARGHPWQKANLHARHCNASFLYVWDSDHDNRLHCIRSDIFFWNECHGQILGRIYLQYGNATKVTLRFGEHNSVHLWATCLHLCVHLFLADFW